MKTSLASLLLLTAVTASPPNLLLNATEPSELTIRLVDLIPDGGPVVVAIFESAETFERRTDPLRSHTLLDVDSVAEWRLEDLPEGEYAIVVFQDRNANGRLDRGNLGVPKEPFGFSNGTRALGPPTFDQARFEHVGTAPGIEVRLVRRSKK